MSEVAKQSAGENDIHVTPVDDLREHEDARGEPAA